MDELKGRLTIIKPNGCKQVIKIYKEAFKSMAKFDFRRVFNDLTADLGGVKWEFDKVD